MTKTNISYLILSIGILLASCKSPKTDLTYSSESLKLIPVSANCYVHKSYLQLDDGSSVECNGMVYVNESAALIFDCPSNADTALEIINWLVVDNKIEIKGLVINHHHNDCIGGIEAFHQRGIKSYAHTRTIEEINDLSKKPQIAFEDSLTINMGSETIINRFFGEGHSKDNITSYVPKDEVLFGGCMIKSLDAKKGNLADANLKEWANTVSKIKAAYPKLKVVIPGHGQSGDTALLDYTIQLFSTTD